MDGAEGEDNAGASHLEVYSSSSEVVFALCVSSALLCQGNSLTHVAAFQVTDNLYAPHVCM